MLLFGGAVLAGRVWERARLPAKTATSFRVVPLHTAIKPEALAEELCRALHLLPQERAAECCGRPQSSLYEQCVSCLSQALSAKTVKLSADSVAKCAQAMQEELRGCDWVRPGLPLPPAACQGLLQGQVPSGGPCHSSLECVAGMHCKGANASSAGQCVPPKPLGASCGRSVDGLAAFTLERGVEKTHAPCADFCSLVSHQCERAPASGSTCRASVNCAAGQHCVDGTCKTESRASDLASSGQACETDLDCARGGCVTRDDGQKVCGRRCPVAISLGN